MDCYLPADFFLLDDARRATPGDEVLGADAHVHIDASAFVTGLRDWSRPEPSRPRGPYPGRTPRRGGARRVMPPARTPSPVDSEWRPL